MQDLEAGEGHGLAEPHQGIFLAAELRIACLRGKGKPGE